MLSDASEPKAYTPIAKPAERSDVYEHERNPRTVTTLEAQPGPCDRLRLDAQFVTLRVDRLAPTGDTHRIGPGNIEAREEESFGTREEENFAEHAPQDDRGMSIGDFEHSNERSIDT